MPITLLALSGSLRRDSMNTALLIAAQELAPPDVAVIRQSLDEIPFFNADVEAGGFPPSVAELRAAVAGADGLLLASPEYNWSTTGVLKNAIDWLSRKPDAPIDRKPAALLSAAGRSGGSRAQSHLRDILAHNSVDVIEEAVQLVRAREHFVGGRLTGEAQRAEVTTLVSALRDHVLTQRLDGTNDREASG